MHRFTWSQQYSIIKDVFDVDDLELEAGEAWLSRLLASDNIPMTAAHMGVVESYPSTFDTVFSDTTDWGWS